MGPHKESDYIDWCENLITVCQANKTAWRLDEEKLTEISEIFAQYKQDYHLCTTPTHNAVDMQRKHETRVELGKKVDTFVANGIQHTYYVSDEGRTQAGVPVHVKKSSPVPAPATIPDMEIELPHPRTIRIKFRVPGASRWGKDHHAKGIEFRWGIADSPPANIDDLPHTKYETGSPLELSFKEDQRGKRIYFALRWEGSSADKNGPWGNILSAVVP